MIGVDGQFQLQLELCTIHISALFVELMEGESTSSCPSINRFESSLVLAVRLGVRDCAVSLSKEFCIRKCVCGHTFKSRLSAVGDLRCLKKNAFHQPC